MLAIANDLGQLGFAFAGWARVVSWRPSNYRTIELSTIWLLGALGCFHCGVDCQDLGQACGLDGAQDWAVVGDYV
jgi:hypothetical protein